MKDSHSNVEFWSIGTGQDSRHRTRLSCSRAGPSVQMTFWSLEPLPLSIYPQLTEGPAL